MTTTLAILTAIRTAEWHHYDTWQDNNYATAGTVGEFKAFDFRISLTSTVTDSPKPIEYRPVGTENWHPTGFQAIARYDASRKPETDEDGYTFYPYRMEELSLTNF